MAASIEVRQHAQNLNELEIEPPVPDTIVTPQTNEPSPPAQPQSWPPNDNLRHIEDAAQPVPTDIDTCGTTANDGGASFPQPLSYLDPAPHVDDLPDPPITIDPHKQAWRRLISRTIPQDELLSLIETIFSDRETTVMVNPLQASDAQVIIDVIDGALDSIRHAPHVRTNCVKWLYRTCRHHSLYPRSLQIEVQYDPATLVHAKGGFAKVWKGKHCGLDVAVKVLRKREGGTLKKNFHRFCKEFVTWKVLDHPNVLPLLGVTVTEDRFAMVSEFMKNGDLRTFVKTNRDMNRFKLLSDVARGLIYMHGQGMIHGDLKGLNILVDEPPCARLADFGLLTIISDSKILSSPTHCGSTRWMSPELLDPGIDDRRQSVPSDCYALGMVIYEALTERNPFFESEDMIIIGMILRGNRPQRPKGEEGLWLTDDTWKLLSHCWAAQPGDRPDIESILQYLEQVSGSWTSHAPLNTQSFTQDSSDITPPPERTEVASHQIPVKLGPEGATGSVNRVMPNGLGEHPPLSTKNLLLTRGLIDEAIGGASPAFPAVSVTGDCPNFIGESNNAGSDQLDRNIPTWKRLISHTFPSYEVTSLVEEIFVSENELTALDDLRGDDAQTFIDVIHEALDIPDLLPWLRRECLMTLSQICSRHALLPRSLQIPHCYNQLDVPHYRGGSADVWKGNHRGLDVAVKVLRVYMNDIDKITSSFYKEVVMWKALRHPNIHPLLGVIMGDGHFAMVSEWMENGNINAFIKAHRGANRFELLKDVTRGLIHMHSQAMIHGDLKGFNIVIDQNGHARLLDFGLLTIAPDPENPSSSSSSPTGGTTRWMSPERIDPGQFGVEDNLPPPTKESDCYALGMVIYEVLSGRRPFSQHCNDLYVMRRIVEGERPKRPKGAERMWFTDDLWGTLNHCWAAKPESRPSIEAVLRFLGRVSRTWKPPPP